MKVRKFGPAIISNGPMNDNGIKIDQLATV